MDKLDQPWPRITSRRAEELARKDQLALADIIELTGQAPDSDGQIGLFDVDGSGFQFTLSETSLRGRPAHQQISGRRLVEQGQLALPCSPTELVNFCEQWREFELPEHFLRVVKEQEASRALDEWRDDLILRLADRNLIDHRIDYAAFRKLTTFDDGDSPHTSGEDALYTYLRNDLGHVIGIEAAGSILEATAGAEGKEAAEWQHRARLEFPTTVRRLVEWIREQGGDVELNFPDNPDWPTDPGRWVEFVAMAAGQDRSSSASSAEQPASKSSSRSNPAREAVREVLSRLEKQPENGGDIERAVRAGLIADAKAAAENSVDYPFRVDHESGHLMKLRGGRLVECDRAALTKVIKRLQNAVRSH